MRLRAVPDLPAEPAEAAEEPEAAPGPLDSSPEPVSAVDQLLARARLGWHRVTAEQAWAAASADALLVDVRTEIQRRELGELPGAVVIDLTVLEWRLDPSSQHRIPEAGLGTSIIVICRQGFSSSLAVSRLRALGLRSVTDVIGGVEAWTEAGLPMREGPADVRR